MAAEVSFARRELQNAFPIEKYKEKGIAPVRLHMLIASTQSDKFVLEWLQKCSEQHTDYIHYRDQEYGLCPLDIAILCERGVIVEALCNRAEVLSGGKDLKGWTSKQHALGRNNEGIIATVSKIYALDYPFIRSLFKPNIPKSEEVVVQYRDSAGEVRGMTQAEFAKRNNGALYYDGLIATPDSLFLSWMKDLEFNPLKLFLEERYQSFLEKRPSLVMTEEGKAGVGVRTQSDMNQGDLVVLYGSELLSPDEPDFHKTVYATMRFTGERKRNFGAMFNDGNPNIDFTQITLDGVVVEAYFALRNIKAGEELLTNYGPCHSAKWRERIEIDEAGICGRFSKKTSLVNDWKRVSALPTKSSQDYLERVRQLREIVYLLHTPSMVCHLILTGNLQIKEVQEVLKDPLLLFYLSFDTESGASARKFYKNALLLLETFEQLPDALKNPVRDHLAASFKKNVRTSYVALKLALDQLTPSNFDRMFKISETFLALMQGESTNEDQDVALIRSVPKYLRDFLLAACFETSLHGDPKQGRQMVDKIMK